MEDDDDDETDGNEKGGNLILEEGYDADQEEGDSDKSDETELKLKNKKQPKQRRQNEYSKQLQIRKGIVIYPQISTILLQLLKVCYGRRLCAGDPDWYAVTLYINYTHNVM